MDSIFVLLIFRHTDFISTYLSLLKEFHKKLDASNLLFTTSSEVGLKSDLKAEDFLSISTYCDIITIFHPYLSVKNENDAFLNRNITYIRDYIWNLVRLGIAPIKIIVGLPLDSPKFIATIDNDNDSKLETYVDYNMACDLLTQEHERDWVNSFNEQAGLSVAIKYDVKINKKFTMILESSRAIANKLRFGMKMINFGGVMLHTLDKDDIGGKCGFEIDTWEDFETIDGVNLHFPERSETFFTLLRTINETIDVVFDEIEQEKHPSRSSCNSVGAMVLISGFFTYLLL